MNDNDKIIKDSWTIDARDIEPKVSTDTSEEDCCCGCEKDNVVYERLLCCECDKPAGMFITSMEGSRGYCMEHSGIGNSGAQFKFNSSSNLRFREKK